MPTTYEQLERDYRARGLRIQKLEGESEQQRKRADVAQAAHDGGKSAAEGLVDGIKRMQLRLEEKDDALKTVTAQVARLAGLSEEMKKIIQNSNLGHKLSVMELLLRFEKALSDLPAAAQGLLKQEFDRGIDVCRRNIASSFNEQVLKGGVVTFGDDDIQKVSVAVRELVAKRDALALSVDGLKKSWTELLQTARDGFRLAQYDKERGRAPDTARGKSIVWGSVIVFANASLSPAPPAEKPDPCPGCGRVLDLPYENGKWRKYSSIYYHQALHGKGHYVLTDCPGPQPEAVCTCEHGENHLCEIHGDPQPEATAPGEGE